MMLWLIVASMLPLCHMTPLKLRDPELESLLLEWRNAQTNTEPTSVKRLGHQLKQDQKASRDTVSELLDWLNSQLGDNSGPEGSQGAPIVFSKKQKEVSKRHPMSWVFKSPDSLLVTPQLDKSFLADEVCLDGMPDVNIYDVDKCKMLYTIEIKDLDGQFSDVYTDVPFNPMGYLLEDLKSGHTYKVTMTEYENGKYANSQSKECTLPTSGTRACF